MIPGATDSGCEVVSVEGVFVTAMLSGVGDVACTIENARERVRGIGSIAAFGGIPECGQSWSVRGYWSEDAHGSFFAILAAAPTIPNDDSVCVWLQYNIIGMGSWYPRQLERAFGRRLTTLLSVGAYEVLSGVRLASKRFPLHALADACTAWAALEREVRIANRWTSAQLRTDIVRVGQLCSDSEIDSYVAAPYRLSAFADFARIDRALKQELDWKQADSDRLLSAVDSVISGAFVTGERRPKRFAVENELAQLLESRRLAHKAVALAIENRRITEVGKHRLQGGGVAEIQQALKQELDRRVLIHAPIISPLHLTDVARHIGTLPRRMATVSLIITDGSEADLSSILQSLDTKFAHSYVVSIHALGLRKSRPDFAARILSHREWLSRSESPPAREPTAVFLLDLHHLPISTWIGLLAAAESHIHIFLVGGPLVATTPRATWTDVIHWRWPEVARCRRGRRSHNIHMADIVAPRRYGTCDSGRIACAEVPMDQCVTAAVGIAWQLQERGLSILTVSPDAALRSELNAAIQRQRQLTGSSSGRTVGQREFFVGDIVVQRNLWAFGMPLDIPGRVSEVYPFGAVRRDCHGRARRVCLEVALGTVRYCLTQAEVESLELAFAVSTHEAGIEGAEAVIVAARNFSGFDRTLARTVSYLAATQLVLVGPGSSSADLVARFNPEPLRRTNASGVFPRGRINALPVKE